MFRFLLRRVLYLVPTLFLVSLISFFVVQLPPGDFLDAYVASLQSGGDGSINAAQLETLRARYGLDQPLMLQYVQWISNILFRGDFGYSFEWNQPVSNLIMGRLGLTLVLSISSLFLVYVVSLLIGIYSARRQYSLGDHVLTFLGFLGLATPNFLLALVVMYVAMAFFGQSVGGLFSPNYAEAPWDLAKLGDFLSHLWIPTLIIGTASTASLIRVMRANLLDELNKPYVVTARAKGLAEWTLLFRYPVRVAINPFVSRLGWELPHLISGAAITSIVLNLPTVGPILLQALKSQDTYLAGSVLLMLSVLTVIGTVVSDLLLVALDPRIRHGVT